MAEERKIKIYAVFQGDLFENEFRGKYIWAPLKSNQNKDYHHWKRLEYIKEGDIIFSLCHQEIKAVLVAKSECYRGKRSENNDNLETYNNYIGRKVDCTYYLLDKPLRTSLYKNEISSLVEGTTYQPFNKKGEGNQGYLFEVNQNLFVFLMNKILERNRDDNYLKRLFSNIKYESTKGIQLISGINKETIKNVLNFRDDREWKQYHNGKDLAISICLEASELLENYQWSAEETERINKIENIKEELADILIYSLMFADHYDFNLNDIINDKLEKNLIKYPNGKKIDLTKK